MRRNCYSWPAFFVSPPLSFASSPPPHCRWGDRRKQKNKNIQNKHDYTSRRQKKTKHNENPKSFAYILLCVCLVLFGVRNNEMNAQQTIRCSVLMRINGISSCLFHCVCAFFFLLLLCFNFCLSCLLFLVVFVAFDWDVCNGNTCSPWLVYTCVCMCVRLLFLHCTTHTQHEQWAVRMSKQHIKQIHLI